MRMRPFSLLVLLLAGLTASGVEAAGGQKLPPVPPPWQLNDVGTVGVPGLASFANGVFRVDGAGDDIWGNEDEFAFLNQEAKGDAMISARITSQSATHEWAKAGIMFRDGLSPNTAYALLGITAKNGLTLSWRYGPSAGTAAKEMGEGGAFTFPIWLRLEKKNTIFTASRSADGKEWTPISTLEIPAPFPELRAGMAVCSHDSGKLSTVLFDKVRFEP